MATITKEVAKMTIGQNVKAFRVKRGLNQRELALITEVSNSTISDIERDTKRPSVKVLRKLAKALHCTMDELAKEE